MGCVTSQKKVHLGLRPVKLTDDVKQKQKNQETTNNIQTPTRA